jgi:hypothetical protein
MDVDKVYLIAISSEEDITFFGQQRGIQLGGYKVDVAINILGNGTGSLRLLSRLDGFSYHQGLSVCASGSISCKVELENFKIFEAVTLIHAVSFRARL